MGQASIRITETLDLDTVLRSVVDGACSLTGACHGGLTILDDAGQLQHFIASGLPSEEHQLVVGLPGGLEFFEHMGGLPEPLRVADLSAYARTVGLPAIGPPLGSVAAFLGVPIKHLGHRVGNLYLADKEGAAAFTPEDERVLVFFASQAALAVANTCHHQEVQQARTDLETLVNTSPVGVVVFDARTGAPLLFNREAQRIVDGLRDPDQSLEQLLEVLTFQRADGRETSLEMYSLIRVLNSGETIRAEEIVLTVPDGRRVTTLVNATPNLSEEGGVASVVVTMQDLAPMKELGRQQAEILDMVSQELLTPLTSIKGSATAVLEDLARLDLTKARQFFSIIEWQSDRIRALIWELLEVARIEAGTLILTPEPTDLASLVGQARASFLEGGANNPVEVDLPSDLPWVMADRQRVLQVLDRLLANAADYSAEGAVVTVNARREDPHVAVCITDQGRGLPFQPLPLLFRRPPNGRRGTTSGTGRDVLSLAVCRSIVEAHGGRIWVENDGAGLGARFLFTLPMAEEAASRRASADARRAVRGQGRVLVVDDDPQMLWHMRNTLTEAGYTLIVTWDPEEVERLIRVERPHLVLLALTLPGTDGLELMQRVLKVTDAPVVVLSEPVQDPALAFEAGADDYITKPFSPTELVARVGAALRRREAPDREAHQESFQLEELTIDYVRRRVTVGDRVVELTATEYRLLCELAVNAGQVLNREHLMSRVWSVREAADFSVVRAYVKRLRQKLGESAANPQYIFNEPRVGYRLGPAKEEWDG